MAKQVYRMKNDGLGDNPNAYKRPKFRDYFDKAIEEDESQFNDNIEEDVDKDDIDVDEETLSKYLVK